MVIKCMSILILVKLLLIFKLYVSRLSKLKYKLKITKKEAKLLYILNIDGLVSFFISSTE